MTPRQERMYEAIRATLLREAAWKTFLVARDQRGIGSAIDEYAEERARTLVGVVDEVLAQLAEEEGR